MPTHHQYYMVTTMFENFGSKSWTTFYSWNDAHYNYIIKKEPTSTSYFQITAVEVAAITTAARTNLMWVLFLITQITSCILIQAILIIPPRPTVDSIPTLIFSSRNALKERAQSIHLATSHFLFSTHKLVPRLQISTRMGIGWCTANVIAQVLSLQKDVQLGVTTSILEGQCGTVPQEW